MSFWIFAAMTVVKVLRSVPRRVRSVFVTQEEYEDNIETAKTEIDDSIEKYGAMSDKKPTRETIYNVSLLAAIVPNVLYLIFGLLVIETLPFYILAGIYTLDLIYSSTILYRMGLKKKNRIKWYERIMDVFSIIFYVYGFVEVVTIVLGL